ncbi:MAG: hypothetical protein C0466_08380 [Candidatus Accumulibacter sp.]|nr:hypothetical protein [Accumulibacter sp.]
MRAAASLGCVLAALSGAAPAAAARLFCCNDDSGRQVCGDILPQACYGRAYREIGESGYTVRRVEAPLSAEQRAQREIDEQRRKEEEAALKEQQRKDMALLNTYGSEKDIEAMRVRAEQDVRKSIANAEAKIADARKNRKRFEDEAEFYKKKTLPAEVDKGLRDADFEIKAQQSVIEAKNKELEIVRAKYDEDRRRFIDLSRRRAVR